MSSTAHSEVNVDLKAETESTVHANVFTGNNIASVIFNYNTAGIGTISSNCAY